MRLLRVARSTFFLYSLSQSFVVLSTLKTTLFCAVEPLLTPTPPPPPPPPPSSGGPRVSKIITAFDSKELKSEYHSTLHQMLAIDYQTYLPDDILQKVDRAGMSVSLEGREPFLDHRVIEWAAQLPQSYKYKKGNKKFILKEIVHQYIPRKMMDRPKMGFGIPVANWLQNDLKPFVDRYFEEQFIVKQGIFNNAEIQRIRHSFYQGKIEKAEKIWYLLMFQMWFDKWINNN